MGQSVTAVVGAQIAVEGVTADDAVITAAPAATATPSVRVAAGLGGVRNRALHLASVSWGEVVAWYVTRRPEAASPPSTQPNNKRDRKTNENKNTNHQCYSLENHAKVNECIVRIETICLKKNSLKKKKHCNK